MSEEDRSYFRRRAEQERRAVEHARDPAAADAHQALAARYSQLAGEIDGGDMLQRAATATPH